MRGRRHSVYLVVNLMRPSSAVRKPTPQMDIYYGRRTTHTKSPHSPLHRYSFVLQHPGLSGFAGDLSAVCRNPPLKLPSDPGYKTP
jgi:hypothetical protein